MKGRLGVARLEANVDTVVYTVPEGKSATVNLCALNQGDEAAKVLVALSVTDEPMAGDYVEAATVPSNGGVLERFGVMVAVGERVIFRTDKGGVVDVRVHGVEGKA